jgi:hypothetical protein
MLTVDNLVQHAKGNSESLTVRRQRALTTTTNSSNGDCADLASENPSATGISFVGCRSIPRQESETEIWESQTTVNELYESSLTLHNSTEDFEAPIATDGLVIKNDSTVPSRLRLKRQSEVGKPQSVHDAEQVLNSLKVGLAILHATIRTEFIPQRENEVSPSKDRRGRSSSWPFTNLVNS